MKIARPPDGFNVLIAPNVRKLVAAFGEAHPPFHRQWEAIVERLQYTGHREGVDEPRVGPGGRTAKFDLPDECGRRAIRIGYTVLGDRLTILIIG